MQKATFEIAKAQRNGKPAVEIIVKNSMYNEALHAECERLGLAPTVDIANRRSIFVTTPAEMDAVRGPLLKFFKTTAVNGIVEAN